MERQILNKITIIGLFLLLVVPMVFAFDTPITIKTAPNKDIDIRIYSSDMTEKIEEYLSTAADKDGKIFLTHSSNRVKFCITTFIREMETGGLKKFCNVTAEREVYIDLIKSNPTLEYLDTKIENEIETINNSDSNFISNETNTDNSINVSVEVKNTGESIIKETKSGITGKIIEQSKLIATSKMTYYILIAIIIIGAGFFVFKKKIIGREKPFKVTKFSEMQKNKEKDSDEEDDGKLASAERKLEEARQELDEIKSKKSKLREAQKRFEKAKTDLEKLEED